MYEASDPAVTDPEVSVPLFQPSAVAAQKQAKRQAQQKAGQKAAAEETACEDALGDADVGAVSEEAIGVIAAAVGINSVCVDEPVSVEELAVRCGPSSSRSSTLTSALPTGSLVPQTATGSAQSSATGKNNVMVLN
jgi:hypothetical protein